MTSKLSGFNLKAIGVVRNAVKQPPGPDYPWGRIVSDIVVNSNLTAALDGLEEFSHIIVLYWLHKTANTSPPALKIHPRGRAGLPLVGLFATRSPRRPNPIGKATVKLLKRQDNILKVEGLDAIDGTPVIDIKPYIHHYDSATNTRAPSWISSE